MKSQLKTFITLVSFNILTLGCQPNGFTLLDPKNLPSTARSADDALASYVMPAACLNESAGTSSSNENTGHSGTRATKSCNQLSIQGGTLDLLDVHILQDLRGLNGLYGCDIWDPMSLGCRKSTFQHCQAMGYLGGVGPIEWEKTSARIACVPKSAGSYEQFGFNGECTSSSPRSIWCQSLTRRRCVAKGYQTSTGVVDALESGITTLCIKGPEVYDLVSFSSVDDLLAPSKDPACSKEAIVVGKGCQHAVSRFCIAKGYSTGFDVLEFNGDTGSGSVSCVKAKVIDTGMVKSSAFDGYERPAVFGTMVLGGASFAKDITYQDAIVNKYSFPIVVTSLSPSSSFIGGAYSKDSCFFLNKGEIFQSDNSDDGEVACTYSEEKLSPSILFGTKTGLLLKPGERLIFQGTPQWGSGGIGLYTGAKVTIAREGLGTVGLRRLRFPQWDTAYQVPAGNSPVTISAGCNKSGCGPTPASVPPGKPLQNSNGWQVMSKATRIRGINFFYGSAQVPGVQRFKGCLRVVQQGGSDLRSPWCFDVSDSNIGPATFNRIFGLQQSGSSYVPLDIEVPAGALIGLDFTLSSESAGGLDLATYVFYEN